MRWRNERWSTWTFRHQLVHKKKLISHKITSLTSWWQQKTKKQCVLPFGVATILAWTNLWHAAVTITVSSVKFWESNSFWKSRNHLPTFFGSSWYTYLVSYDNFILNMGWIYSHTVIVKSRVPWRDDLMNVKILFSCWPKYLYIHIWPKNIEEWGKTTILLVKG